MKLTGKVVKVESASQFIDKVERIHIRINEADNMFCELRLRNLACLKLDDEVEIEVNESTESYVAKVEKISRVTA